MGSNLNPKMAKINGQLYTSGATTANNSTALNSLNSGLSVGLTQSQIASFKLKNTNYVDSHEVLGRLGLLNTNEFMKDVEQVNKLTNATSKMFNGVLGSNKSTDENFLPEIKDVTLNLYNLFLCRILLQAN